MHLLWAGGILGIAAVFGVPLVSKIIGSIVGKVWPQATAYLPSPVIPNLSLQVAITTAIYGVLFLGVLHILRMVGLSTRGVRA